MLDTKSKRRVMVLDLVLMAISPLMELMDIKDKMKLARGELLVRHEQLMEQMRSCDTMAKVAELMPKLRELEARFRVLFAHERYHE